MLKDAIMFIREGAVNFQHTGTIFATSSWAAKELSHPINGSHLINNIQKESNFLNKDSVKVFSKKVHLSIENGDDSKMRTPLSILELGAGTGSVTEQILAKMNSEDTLMICEINPSFMRQLKSKLEKNQNFQTHRSRITFFTGPVQELPEDTSYNAFIASLPFLNFDIETVNDIFTKLERIAQPESVMTYYEYIGLRRIGKVLSPQTRRERLHQIDSFFREKHASQKLFHKRVWLNMLPIKIHTLKIGAESALLAQEQSLSL
jgi:phosphatidylethanolamine/phosphatidyl-N-methylethanolamine N-methyltransferase